MILRIKKSNFKAVEIKKKKPIVRIYPTVSRFENKKLTAFSFMTSSKGK